MHSLLPKKDDGPTMIRIMCNWMFTGVTETTIFVQDKGYLMGSHLPYWCQKEALFTGQMKETTHLDVE